MDRAEEDLGSSGPGFRLQWDDWTFWGIYFVTAALVAVAIGPLFHEFWDQSRLRFSLATLPLLLFVFWLTSLPVQSGGAIRRAIVWGAMSAALGLVLTSLGLSSPWLSAIAALGLAISFAMQRHDFAFGWRRWLWVVGLALPFLWTDSAAKSIRLFQHDWVTWQAQSLLDGLQISHIIADQTFVTEQIMLSTTDFRSFIGVEAYCSLAFTYALFWRRSLIVVCASLSFLLILETNLITIGLVSGLTASGRQFIEWIIQHPWSFGVATMAFIPLVDRLFASIFAAVPPESLGLSSKMMASGFNALSTFPRPDEYDEFCLHWSFFGRRSVEEGQS